MRKITVISMVTLDGVMQAPGGPDEDRSGGFEYGGWVAPFTDEKSNEVFSRLMKPTDLLLGRKTFEIWENYWPSHEHIWKGVNDVTKYVLSSSRDKTDWNNSVFLKSSDDIKELKKGSGAGLQVWGSSGLIQFLLKNDLVDEMWILTYPVTLGQGKKLFQDGAIPAAFKMIETRVSGKGVIMANYKREGNVETGNLGD